MAKLNRDITNAECFWIEETIPKGTIVEEFTGCTYDCITSTGTAVTIEGREGFVEVPTNSLYSYKYLEQCGFQAFEFGVHPGNNLVDVSTADDIVCEGVSREAAVQIAAYLERLQVRVIDYIERHHSK